jgi:hypothetical protein
MILRKKFTKTATFWNFREIISFFSYFLGDFYKFHSLLIKLVPIK